MQRRNEKTRKTALKPLDDKLDVDNNDDVDDNELNVLIKLLKVRLCGCLSKLKAAENKNKRK